MDLAGTARINLFANPSASSQSTYAMDLPARHFNLIEEHDLSKTEDAPMSIAVNPFVRSSPPLALMS